MIFIKKKLFFIALLCTTPVTLLANISVSDYSDVKDYPGLKVRTLVVPSERFLGELGNYVPYVDKVRDAYNTLDDNYRNTSYIGSDPRPASYNLTKHNKVDYLYEHSSDSVGVYGGLDGMAYNYAPYSYDVEFIIQEYIIPETYVDELFFDFGQRGGYDEGYGFLAILLDDSDLIYYSDSYKLLDRWSGNEYKSKTRVTTKLNSAAKMSVISYRSDGSDYYDRFTIRKIPKDISYSAHSKSNEDKELGDHTLSNVLYDLELHNKYVEGLMDTTNPFYSDIDFNIAINGILHPRNALSNLTSYYVEDGKLYTLIQTRNFVGDKLSGARGEYLGYGEPPLSWKLEIKAKMGRPILQELIDLANSMGYNDTPRFIILNDANRRWDFNQENINLVNTLAKTLEKNNIELILIGEYDPALFGPLMK